MEESKQVLGWIISPRFLTIALPGEKHSKWTKDINNMISSGKNKCQKTLTTHRLAKSHS
jgi:hypothetical protein